MCSDPKSQTVFVNDGDTIAVIAKTGICVSDPCDDYPYVSQAYRVVAARPGPMLALVPLNPRAGRVSQKAIDEHVGRKSEEAAAILNPEVPKTTTYSTYIMGDDAILFGKSQSLTLSEVRMIAEQLKSRSVKPVDGQFFGWVHPEREAEVAEWIEYKWNYKWTAARS